MAAIDQLQQKLGYHFQNKQLLDRALTHSSLSGKNYERLEFLGDSILNFVVAELVFKKMPNDAEGSLSRVRASLVNQTTLAQLAHQLALPPLLKMGVGALKSGCADRPSILADVVEAIFAGIYLDSGSMQTVQQVITTLYLPLMAHLDYNTAGKDTKTILQEMMQAYNKTLPNYILEQTTGSDHSQEFWVRCTLTGLEIETQGKGMSRRQAERVAAEKAIELMQQALSLSTHKKGRSK